MKLQPFQLHYLATRIEQAHTLQSWVGEYDIRKQVASGSLPRIDHSRIERLEKLETIDATPYMKKLATIVVFVREQIDDDWATPTALRKINTFVEEFYRLIDIAWENRERKTIDEYVDYDGSTYEISKHNDRIAADTPSGWYEFADREVAMEYLADMADRFGYE